MANIGLLPLVLLGGGLVVLAGGKKKRKSSKSTGPNVSERCFRVIDSMRGMATSSNGAKIGVSTVAIGSSTYVQYVKKVARKAALENCSKISEYTFVDNGAVYRSATASNVPKAMLSGMREYYKSAQGQDVSDKFIATRLREMGEQLSTVDFCLSTGVASESETKVTIHLSSDNPDEMSAKWDSDESFRTGLVNQLVEVGGFDKATMTAEASFTMNGEQGIHKNIFGAIMDAQ